MTCDHTHRVCVDHCCYWCAKLAAFALGGDPDSLTRCQRWFIGLADPYRVVDRWDWNAAPNVHLEREGGVDFDVAA